tara:strand:+ start:754 stop:2559 length:1806 start_codon:yes stop_codon:yes gene_type:complete
MYILGLSLGILSTASILKNNKILFTASEERFTKIKNDESYPLNAINFVLKEAKIKGADLSKVVIAGKNLNLNTHLMNKYSKWNIEDHFKIMNDFWKPKLLDKKQVNFNKIFKNKININQYPGKKKWMNLLDKISNDYEDRNNDKYYLNFIHKTISNHLKINPKKITHLDHHFCHASYAYWASPIRNKKTLILTADAFGDGLSSTVYIADNKNKIKLLESSNANEFQLGRYYRNITLLLSMMPDAHEYKLMGLAPYAKSKYTNKVFKILKNTMYLDGTKFKYKEKPSDLFFFFKEKFQGIRFDNIAGGLQKYTEYIMTNYVKNLLIKYKCSNLVYSGGVSMNVKVNLLINNLNEVKTFFVPPSGGDESLAMGACFGFINNNKKIQPKPLENVYLGFKNSTKNENDCVNIAKKDGLKIIKYDEKIVAKLLSKNYVIATCFGRAEFGARSLGNRSILANPSEYMNIHKINEKIKNRDFWMPFAPVIINNKSNNLILNEKNTFSPYMTIAFNSKKSGFKKLIAASHPADKTIRPQMLLKETNSKYYSIINQFFKITGIPSLLNTSFNLHGYPIVNKSIDAYDVFKKTGLDILVLDNFIILKSYVK